MRKVICLFFVMLLIFCPVFAKADIDSVLHDISENISTSLGIDAIVCVLDFNAITSDMGEYIQTQLVSELMEFGRVRIVTRAEMDKVDAELQYHLSGDVSDATALSICQRLGANAIMFGQLKELDNNYNLQVKVLDVERGSYLLFKTYQISRSSKTEQLLGRSSTYCKTSLGAIVEANKNSISSIAPGIGLYFDYNFTRKLTIGVKGNGSFDVSEKENSIYTVEPVGFFRLYLSSPSGEPSTGMFIEGDYGESIILVNDSINFSMNIGGTVGFRQEISSMYVEPYFSFGYPFMFKAGLCSGIRM